MKFFVIFCAIIVAAFHYSAAGMAGGWSEISDVNSSGFQKVVSFAAKKISEGSNSMYLLKPVEVLNARKQVVAGMNYKFTLRLAATECKKNKSKNVDVNECQLLRCGPVENCKVTVWVKSWEKDGTRLTNQSCQREPKSC